MADKHETLAAIEKATNDEMFNVYSTKEMGNTELMLPFDVVFYTTHHTLK